MADTETKVTEVSDEQVAQLFNIGGATAMTAGEEKQETNEEKSFFSTQNTEVESFIEKPLTSTEEKKEEEEKSEEEKAAEAAAAAEKKEETPAQTETKVDGDAFSLDKGGEKKEETSTTEDPEKNKGGRPSNIVAVTNKLVEEGVFSLFEGEDDLSKYTAEDYEELYKMNIKNIQDKNLEQTQQQFFQSLPPELQQAYTYIYNGGQDLKGLFQALGAAKEIQTLDTASELGQENVVRAYLQAVQFGTPEEIEAEINGIKDRDELEKKAQQFHPKLEERQNAVIQQRLQFQEQQKAMREQASQQYAQSIYETLKPGQLNGIELTQKQQDLLYAGLTQANYPSSNGGQTNLFGKILEDIQWGENRNHALLAEMLLLATDREAYHEQIRKSAVKENNKETVRTLKSAAAEKTGSSTQETETDDKGGRSTGNGIKREPKSFFARD